MSEFFLPRGGHFLGVKVRQHLDLLTSSSLPSRLLSRHPWPLTQCPFKLFSQVGGMQILFNLFVTVFGACLLEVFEVAIVGLAKEGG